MNKRTIRRNPIMKRLSVVMLVSLFILGLASCNDDTPNYDGLDSDISGVVDLLLWSGSGQHYEDIGSLNLSPSDLVGQNDAAAYYVAKEFNKIYPNVKINVLAVDGSPDGGDRIWAQELANYETNYNAHPGVWATTDLAGDIAKGKVADLSRFEDDPLYQAMNPSIMQMMNYYGFQGGLPQYILPWGIYVNKDLAESKNLDVPNWDWTIDEYTRFIGHKKENEWYGSMETPIGIIETGSTTVNKMLFEYSSGDVFVNVNSEEVRELFKYIQEWDENSVWGGEIDETFMGDHWWWDYKFFLENKLLTLAGAPWMMGDCATPSTEENPYPMACKSSDWDIYPRPSTEYVDNTVGIVLDPMAVYNFCMEDKDSACTEEEEMKIKVAYTFASFWIADSRSWLARANGEFTVTDDEGNTSLSSSLNDSFPVTTGDLFDEQMQIWYTPEKHQRFADKDLMPGFQEVLRIYKEGQFWDVSDKAFPYWHTVEGTVRANMHNWRYYYAPNDNGGVEKGDANFEETILGNLPVWNDEFNQNFAISFEQLREGLKRWYQYTDEDFE